MIDTGLIAEELRANGHTVENIIAVPNNAGEYEFEIDGEILSLTETRALLEADEAQKSR